MKLLLTGANGFVGRYVQAARTFGRDRGGGGDSVGGQPWGSLRLQPHLERAHGEV